MKKVTIQDIAAEMNMSRNTVAKALNGGDVAPHTRQAIVKKAWQMGYSKIDSSLLENMETQTKRMNAGTIVVLLKKWESVFWSRMIEGVSHELNSEGYRMQLQVMEEGKYDGISIVNSLAPDVMGFLFLTIFPIEFVRQIAKAGKPMTFYNTPVNGQEYFKLGDVISTDGFYSMSEITTYLIKEKGCRSLSFIGNTRASRVVQARYLGYLNGCRQLGLEVDEGNQYTALDEYQTFTYKMVEQIINNLSAVPDAFVCENDEVAQFVALALVQKNPELVKSTYISGFEDTIGDDFFKKDILTVKVNIEEIGRRLVKSVIERVEKPQQDLVFITVATYPVIK